MAQLNDDIAMVAQSDLENTTKLSVVADVRNFVRYESQAQDIDIW